MIYVLWLIFELVIIYLPLFIIYKKGKITSSKVLVWSTIWCTLFTQSLLDVLFAVNEYVAAGYVMTTSDYLIVACVILLSIGNIGLIHFLDKWFISKEVKQGNYGI